MKETEREANQIRELKEGGGKPQSCSETHLSWIVSVSAAGQADAEAVRVCESLNGVLEKDNQKHKQTNKNKKQKERQRCNFERSRPDKGDNEKPVKSNLKK